MQKCLNLTLPFGIVDLNGVIQQGYSKFICMRMPGKGSHHTVRPGKARGIKTETSLLLFKWNVLRQKLQFQARSHSFSIIYVKLQQTIVFMINLIFNVWSIKHQKTEKISSTSCFIQSTIQYRTGKSSRSSHLITSNCQMFSMFGCKKRLKLLIECQTFYTFSVYQQKD